MGFGEYNGCRGNLLGLTDRGTGVRLDTEAAWRGAKGDHINYSVWCSLRKGYLFQNKLCINYRVCYLYQGPNCIYTCCAMETGIINEGGGLI
jgi:hypothetical protein